MPFNGTGSNVTSLNASNISSGTVAPARLGSGSPSSSNFLRGDGTWASAGGVASNKQVFTSSGTFNVPAGVSTVKVTVIGAGGSGGTRYSDACGSNVGGGGGAGGYVVDYVSVTPGGTATVTVGTNAGSRTSSFAGSTTLTASGGTNGSNAVAYSCNSGVSASSSVFGQTYYSSSVSRSYGNGYSISDIFTAALSSNFLGSIAGIGQCYAHGYGLGGWFNNQSGISAGRQNPLGYGAGGGGGDSSGGPTNGTNGIVIVEW